MNGFFWAGGHLGWGIFAVAAFTALGWLAADLVWRLTATKIVRLASALAVSWLVGVALIVLGYVLTGG